MAKRAELLQLRVSKVEKASLDNAARKEHFGTTSSWARKVLLDVAEMVTAPEEKKDVQKN